MTTILDLADQLGARDGFDVPSPRWRAVLAFFDGLPLSDADVAELAAATRRTPEAILSRSGRPFSELWCRVGRRGRKSSTAALIALREACFGGHDAHLMPSERGLVAVVSRDIAGSTVVARMLESFANALGISCRWTSMGSVRLLELDGFSFAVACLPCSATAPRGYAIAVVICDEIAHWQTDGDVYTDSDAAVLGAIRPAIAQFPRARLVAISSPLGHEGVFHSTVEASLGADGPDDVLSVQGATWEFSPDVTEARTHEIEKDPEIHSREFGAQPSDNEGTAFVLSHVERCFGPDRGGFVFPHKPMMWLDVGERVDTFAYCIGAWGEPDPTPRWKRLPLPKSSGLFPEHADFERDEWGSRIALPKATRPLLQIFRVGGWTGPEVARLGMDRIVQEVVGVALENGCSGICGDQRAAPFMAALISRSTTRHLPFKSVTWSQESKHESVNLLRAWMRDGQLAITDHSDLRAQLIRYKRRIVGGGFKYGVPSQADDFAATLITAAMQHVTDQRGTSTSDTFAPIDGAPTRRTQGGQQRLTR